MNNLKKLRDLGEAMHGPRWQRPVATDLDIDDRQVRRWASGEYEVPTFVIDDLVAVARRRVMQIKSAISAATK